MTNSILTNLGSMVALQNLQATQKSMLEVQSRISTGLKVANAKDDAATWTIATQMSSDVNNLQEISKGLGAADSALSFAVNGAKQVADLISQIRGKVTDAQAAGADKTSVQGDIKQLLNQIDATVKASSYNGVNLTDATYDDGGTLSTYAGAGGSGTALSFASSVDTGGTSTAYTIDVGGSDLSVDAANAGAGATNTNMAALAAIDVTGATTYQAMLTTIDAATDTVKQSSAAFGSTQKRVQMQQTFVNSLVDTLKSSISNMVDSDMTQESARLSALQTQQQLGVQALSIANQSSQAILSLFR